MAFLMLKDIPIYDISENIVLNPIFLPFRNNRYNRNAFQIWLDNRAYLKSNRTAERIVTQMGGPDTCEAKRRLSLSDSYWIKYDYDKNVKFDAITPYSNMFSLLDVSRGTTSSDSIPELVTSGSQPKQWKRGQDGITYLSKAEQSHQIHTEMLAVRLAMYCRLKTMNAFILTEKGKIYANNYGIDTNYETLGLINLINFTNTDRSMIQLDYLGIGVNGYDVINITDAYTKAGVEEDVQLITLTQILFDAVIGNVDRRSNNSNWAIFIDHDTGKRTPSWLYDFNWANLITENTEMISDVANYIKIAGLGKTALRLLTPIMYTCEMLSLEIWHNNAKLLEYLLSRTLYEGQEFINSNNFG